MTAETSTQHVALPAAEGDAPDIHALTQAAFAAYAETEPHPSVFRETVGDIAAELRAHGGFVVRDGSGRLVAAARVSVHDGGFWLRRVAVDPDFRGAGLGALIAQAAEDDAVARGYDELRVGVRLPLTDLQQFWRHLGFAEVARHDHWVELARPLPIRRAVPTTDEMVSLGRALGGLVRAGDLLVLSGDLGAGKTTLTRGLGEGLGVRGQVTSPTFVIARVHPSTVGGPALVHVDAYRLESFLEVEDLDLDASLEESVTVVEWGTGKVEALADSRLEVEIHRSADEGDEARTAVLRGRGPSWPAHRLASLR